MELESLKVTVVGPVAHVLLLERDGRQTTDLRRSMDLADCTRRLITSPDVDLVVLRAEGKNFSFGGDLPEIMQHRDEIGAFIGESIDHFHAAISRFTRMGAIVVCGVQGVCAGSGVSLALAADLTVVSTTSRFTMAYSAVGFTPDGGPTHHLSSVIGRQRSFDLIATNPTVTGQQMAEMGLVARAVDPEMLDTEIDSVVDRLRSSNPESMRVLKQLLWAKDRASLESQLASEQGAISDVASTPRTLSMLDAFASRRQKG
jgi:2-(1,2-epoxy-1,2-dihydrophenyl)acetyl-CoA isomerase